MKLFVTGATGMVGSRFVSYLLKQGHAARILVRNPESAFKLKEQGAEVVVGDLVSNKNLTEALRGVDAVVHIAAQMRGNPSEEISWAVNVDATTKLAKAALEAGVTRFVFTSTNRVYEGSEVDRPCREGDPLTATEVYPKTKIAAEAALLSLYHQQGLDLRILRLAGVYGDGDPSFVAMGPILVNLNPAMRFSLIHHEDLDQALMLASTTPGIGGRIYNVADDQYVPLSEIIKLYGVPEQVSSNVEWPEYDKWDMVADTSNIKKELNFQPKYPSINTASDMGAL